MPNVQEVHDKLEIDNVLKQYYRAVDREAYEEHPCVLRGERSRRVRAVLQRGPRRLH
jgi:hypothetical protein